MDFNLSRAFVALLTVTFIQSNFCEELEDLKELPLLDQTLFLNQAIPYIAAKVSRSLRLPYQNPLHQILEVPLGTMHMRMHFETLLQ